ncbi:ribonuclease P protein component [Paludibacter sp.]
MISINKFPKGEHLCSSKRIDSLFSEGKSFSVFPIRCVYRLSKDEEQGVKILFNVPKKKFKLAVHRNKIKRRMKESYRLNKNELLDLCISNKIALNIAFLYISDKPADYKVIEEKTIQAIDKIINILK